MEDHCHLLCSLLNGLGLKAFVCVGLNMSKEHSWVMTEGNNTVTFWECTKGLKLDFFSPKALTFYKAIHSVYNHEEYFASLQLDDSVAATKFNFKDRTLWKKMNSVEWEGVEPFNRGLALQWPTLNPYLT